MSSPGLFRQTWAIFAKELRIEWRSPSRLSSLFFFALLIVLVAAFAHGTAGSSLARHAPGVLWIGLLLTSTRGIDRSFSTELDQGALEGLLLWPVHGAALYYGKALANTAILVLVGLMLTPLLIAIYDAPIRYSILWYFSFLFFGCSAISAPGTIFGLIASQSRGASVLLPILLFPLIVPALIAASRGTSLAMAGDLMNEAPSWFGLLFAFNVLHWSISSILFMRLLEDG